MKTIGKIMQGNDGLHLYLVFDSEDQAEQFALESGISHKGFCCFDGYMNAIVLI